jgi:hypothetical protein
MTSKEKVIFEINGADAKKLKRFERQHKNCPMGMEGGRFSYTFTPTGLGLAITVKCTCGQQLLLGDFLEGPDKEYDEVNLRPLTEDDIKNKQFEDAALLILNLEDRRFFKMAMGLEQIFEIVYAYAVGVARYGDPRISKTILYKVSFDDAHNLIMNYTGTDEENLAEFFEYFKRAVLEEMDKYHSDNERLRKKCLSKQDE